MGFCGGAEEGVVLILLSLLVLMCWLKKGWRWIYGSRGVLPVFTGFRKDFFDVLTPALVLVQSYEQADNTRKVLLVLRGGGYNVFYCGNSSSDIAAAHTQLCES